MRTLRECFLEYDLALLEAIAASRGVLLEEQDPRQAAVRLSEALADESSLHKALARLGPEAWQALRMLQHAGGRVHLPSWERRWGEIRPFGPGRLRREEPWRQPANVSERLWYLGLLARAFDQEGGRTLEFVFIPSDLQPVVGRWLGTHPSPGGPLLRPLPDVPGEIRGAGETCLEALLAYLVFLYNWRVRASRAGTLHQEDRAALRAYVAQHAPPLGGQDAQEWLEIVAQEAGLTRLEAGRLRPDPDAARSWLEAPPARALLTLQRAWLATLRWNDLWHVPGLRCEATGWTNDPHLARQAVLGALGRLEPGAWYALEDLVESIRRENPDFQRPDGDYDSWFIRHERTGRYLHGFEDWPHVEGALIRYLVSGPLHWLGVVDLGGEAAAFRLTPSGRAFLKGEEVEGPEEAPLAPARLTQDLEVWVPEGFSRYRRFQLARLAVWEPGGPPYRYRLTASSAGRAFRQGLERTQVEKFLSHLTGAALPAEVRRALRLWETRAREVRLRRAVVLEVRDAGVLQQLLEDTGLRKWVGERLSERHVLVPQRNLQRLMDELDRQGYAARLEKE